MNTQNFNDPNTLREAQDRLRSLGIIYEIEELRIPQSGTFDTSTERAVTEFQGRNGLPVTGQIDEETWRQLKLASDFAKKLYGKRQSISPYPSGRRESVSEGERSELVFISQLMLNALALYYDLPQVPLNGIFDEITSEAVKLFQRNNMIEESGEIDPLTWDLLAEEYNLTVTDSQ